MATNDQLKRLSPKGAVVRMVNDLNATQFDGSEASALQVSPPQALTGHRTQVELSVRKPLSGSDRTADPGVVNFRFNRLDVDATLGGKLGGYRPAMPSSTRVLLDELTRRTGIVFQDEDFVLEDINRDNAAPYILKAKAGSLRWLGSTSTELLDLTDLSVYLSGSLPAGPYRLGFKPVVWSTKDHQPYLNATSLYADLLNIALNEPVASPNHPLLQWLSKAVGALGDYKQGSASPWVYNAAVAPYNARGAVLISRDESKTGLNVLVPAATKVARVRLTAADSVYGDKDLLIPYSVPTFATSDYTPAPRLKSAGVINASDGTPWNKWLNTLPAPSILTSLPVGLNLRFSGPDEWVTDPNNPSPTNLYNAVVQYNGSPRGYDVQPYNPLCNRLVIFTVSSSNTAYQGNLTFHYRAPIIVNETLPDAVLGSPYNFDLQPREGVAPYSLTFVSGALCPSHALVGSVIQGSTDSTGRYSVTYDVTDAVGTKVRYLLQYRSVVGPLVLQGNPPAGVRGQPYSYTFQISGGVPDYLYQLTDRSDSTELTVPDPNHPMVSGAFSNTPGDRHFVLRAIDQQGTTTEFSFTVSVP